MRKHDREIIEIGEFAALDTVIEGLLSLRGRLPEGCEPQVAIRGDDNFGWRLIVTYFRELTADESQLEARYAAEVSQRGHHRHVTVSRPQA